MVVGTYRDGRPSVEGIIRLPGDGRWASVSFVIDTGSEITIISQVDLFDKLGVDACELEMLPEEALGIGGKAPLFGHPGPAEVDFEGLDSPIRLDIRAVLGEEGVRDHSLLGQDVLDNFGLFAHRASAKIFLLTHEEVSAAWGNAER